METFKKSETVPVSNVRTGDCVFIHGRWKTLSKSDVKRGFTGVTICGDPLVLEGRKIVRALFRKSYKGVTVGWCTQL